MVALTDLNEVATEASGGAFSEEWNLSVVRALSIQDTYLLPVSIDAKPIRAVYSVIGSDGTQIFFNKHL